jgi:PAS domain S-box-containing protein
VQVDPAAAAAQDRGDRRNTQVAIEAALLPALFESSSVAMISLDTAGKVLAVSPPAEGLLGYSEAELLDVTLHARVHYQRRDGAPRGVDECPLCRAVESAHPAVGEDDAFTRKDGVIVPVAWVVAPIVLAGEHTGAIIVFYDTVGARGPGLRAKVGTASGEAANLRLGLLADASHTLISAPSLRSGLGRVAQLLVPVAADWVVIDLLDEASGRIERAAVAHHNPALQEQGVARLGELPALRPEMIDPLAVTLRGGPTVHLTDFAPAPDLDALARARLDLFQRLGTAEAITAPMRTRTRTVGAITLVRSDPVRRYEAADLQLAGELATRAAFAVENALLLEQYEWRAESLQRALLPQVPDRLGGVRLSRLYRPTDDLSRVGGDWYDAFELRDGSIALVIGDVAGHDMSAASRMGAIRHKLRAIAQDRLAPPAEVLTRLDVVIQHIEPTDLVTLVYARLTVDPIVQQFVDPGVTAAWRVEWANAGHPPPLLLMPGEPPRFLDAAPDPPLGVTDAGRTTHRLSVPTGTALVLYTDGLVERREDASIDVGLARLVDRATDLLAGSGPVDLGTFPEDLVSIVRIPATDDIAVLAAHVSGGPLPAG